MQAAPLHILHLEDDPADAAEVERTLAHSGIAAIIRRVTSADEYRQALTEFVPDVVLSDHISDDYAPLQALADLRARHPGTPLILATDKLDESAVVESLRAGIDDYVVKQRLDRLIPAVRSAVAARQPLRLVTPRQREVLRLIVEGLSTREAARRLRLSVKTVETHRAELMRRLGIRDIPGLVRYAIRIGLITPDA